MWPVSVVGFSLLIGFLAGHGFELPIDLVPLLVAIVVGFAALKAAEGAYER